MKTEGWSAWRAAAKRRERSVITSVVVRQQTRPSPDPPAGAADETASTDEGATTRTGCAGRPPIFLDPIKGELRRRAEQGEMITTLKAEAEHLVEWCRLTHGGAPKPKTLQNSLRDLHRELKSLNTS